MSFEWWHWIVLGIALMVAELAVPQFVLFWFGLGALLVGLSLLVLPGLGLTAQLLLWTLASLVMIFLWFRVFKRGAHKTRIGMSDANVVGEIGVLTRDVEPFRRGSVRFQKPLMGSEVWECIADESIQINDRVRVTSIEGNILKVGKA